MTPPLALIAGAGVAGLSAAWWLGRAGWRSVIVERARNLRGGAYMLGLSGPGYETAGRMGLHAELAAVAYKVDENVYRDRYGRELLRLRYREFIRDLPYVALRRSDLVAALHGALPANTELRLATTITAIDQDGRKASAVLSDGAQVDADLVIAADGFRSTLRPLMFGPDDPRLKPLGYRFAVYDIDDPIGLGSDFLSYAEPGHLAEYYALRGDRLAALHVWRDGRTGPVPADARWPLLEHVTARSFGRVRELMAKATADGVAPIIDDLTLVDAPVWSKGRVVLLGDAAHCLTLISGQGAGMAMTSAEMLGRELARSGDVGAALIAHEARLRPAIERLQQRSRRMASMFIPESPLAFHVRNVVLRHMPRAWLGRYFLNAVKAEIGLVQEAA
ncbi:FAD-dependent monooxygenase [Chelatococcus reniformis]|uniref:Oxidoreductase n=1 Tax=Chelatococcus reniformis TaxID=1494448 RepID=A0A916XI10_9HYPH|nr:FAD-dependent monooxygenase [Chelatococcus reniformis]GGC74707.1 oxidoreductase [Chelatococcus reniformis]